MGTRRRRVEQAISKPFHWRHEETIGLQGPLYLAVIQLPTLERFFHLDFSDICQLIRRPSSDRLDLGLSQLSGTYYVDCFKFWCFRSSVPCPRSRLGFG